LLPKVKSNINVNCGLIIKNNKDLMKAKQKILVVIAALGLTLSSCYWHNWDTIHPQVVTKPCTVDTGTVISYSANIVPIVNSKCAVGGCHSAGSVAGPGSPGDYTFYGSAGSHGSGFASVCSGDTSGSSAWQDITAHSGNPMPQLGSPQLTPCEKATLRNWIHQGALNN
jgi:hypothetical protein